MCDRWAHDLAGPLHRTKRGNVYVVAYTVYDSKFVAAIAVLDRTAAVVARVLMEEVVLCHGPFRELLTDGARELVGKSMSTLVHLLQAKQMSPIPYRANLMGLVERFSRTWKDTVSLTMNEEQDDWDLWLQVSVYACNSAEHTSTGFTPNELTTGQ